MYRMNRVLTLLALAALLAGACQPIVALTPDDTQTEAALPVPRFEPSACKYSIPEWANTTCGYLVVREDRSQPGGEEIRLHVVIFKGASAEPAADPLILLNGGPGSAGQPMIDGMLYSHVGAVWRSAREVIYIDQRGTGFSIPSLYCPETAIAQATVASTSYTATMAAETSGLQRCYTRLYEDGVNLAAYNLAESAADINDLRLALGYAQVNLYGFSYGSLLAEAIMLDHPAALRSVVMDSVLPLGTDLVHERPVCLQSGLQALFAGCAADAACQAAYPALEAHFYAVLERLRESPAVIPLNTLGEIHLVMLDDLKFLDHIFYQLQRGAVHSLPRTIEAAFARNYSQPAWGWLSYAAGEEIEAGPLTPPKADGLYYSTLCNYAAGLAAAGAESSPCASCAESGDLHPSLAAYAGFMLTPCAFWEAGAAPARLAMPMPAVQIPALLLTGAYDCALPFHLSQKEAGRLGDSYHFVLPVGHTVVASQCGLDLTRQFLADPTQAPDSACIGEMEMNWAPPE